MKKKIGIMGGTFDPIHVGHLILGEKAYEQFGLDRVLFMPSGNPPHKRDREGRATDVQRIQMVRRAIDGNPHFSIYLEEMYRKEISYTYLTMQRLNQQNPDTEYYFIIGADSLFDFETWMKPEIICANCTLLVAGRGRVTREELLAQMEMLGKKYKGRFLELNVPTLDIASHILREWTARSQSIRYYVPDAVGDYIKENKIYQPEGEQIHG